MSEGAWGAAAALGSAAAWALSALLWRRAGDALTPAGMNLVKCFLGAAFMGLLLAVSGRAPAWGPDSAWLAASGLLGIALGDTFFFRALMTLGPRLTTLMAALGPVITALASAALLGERPTPADWLGIVLTSSGVAWVMLERSGTGPAPRDRGRGALFALVSCSCTALSVVLAKKGVAATPATEAAFQRLLWGGFGLAAWGAASGALRAWAAPLSRPQVLRRAAAATAVAAFGGFWLSMAALRRVDASVAGALGATTPLFVLPLSVWVYGERVRWRAALGAAVAVAGVALLVSGL